MWFWYCFLLSTAAHEELTAANWDTMVGGKDIFVHFASARSRLRVWDQLMEEYSDEIVLAYVDVTTVAGASLYVEKCSGRTPFLMYFKKDNAPETYTRSRSLEALQRFIDEKIGRHGRLRRSRALEGRSDGNDTHAGNGFILLLVSLNIGLLSIVSCGLFTCAKSKKPYPLGHPKYNPLEDPRRKSNGSVYAEEELKIAWGATNMDIILASVDTINISKGLIGPHHSISSMRYSEPRGSGEDLSGTCSESDAQKEASEKDKNSNKRSESDSQIVASGKNPNGKNTLESDPQKGASEKDKNSNKRPESDPQKGASEKDKNSNTRPESDLQKGDSKKLETDPQKASSKKDPSGREIPKCDTQKGSSKKDPSGREIPKSDTQKASSKKDPSGKQIPKSDTQKASSKKDVGGKEIPKSDAQKGSSRKDLGGKEIPKSDAQKASSKKDLGGKEMPKSVAHRGVCQMQTRYPQQRPIGKPLESDLQKGSIRQCLSTSNFPGNDAQKGSLRKGPKGNQFTRKVP